MPTRGPELYRSPPVLQRVMLRAPEPYRTLLVVHAYLSRAFRGGRERLAEATIDDVQTVDGIVYVCEAALDPYAARILQLYLGGPRARIASPWLFPLPRDPARPANPVLAKRYLNRAAAGRL